MDKQPRLRPNQRPLPAPAAELARRTYNPHVSEYAGRLGVTERHIELRDPDNPQLGNKLVDGPYPDADA